MYHAKETRSLNMRVKTNLVLDVAKLGVKNTVELKESGGLLPQQQIDAHADCL
jgi:hypothetical protein